MVTITETILRSIARQKSPVVLLRDFEHFGSAPAVSRAFADAVSRGRLIRLGAGVYVKAQNQGGRPVMAYSFNSLVIEALNRLGIRYELSPLMKDWLSGKTDQIPTRLRIKTLDRSRRKMSYGRLTVEYVSNF